MSIRVLLADDEPLVRTGLSLILSTDPDIDVVGTAGTGEEALTFVSSNNVDVAVIDVRMPVMDGVEAIRSITALGVSTRTLILTTYNTDEAVFAALRAGASGFLLKDAAPADLINAVKAVAQGQGWLAPAVSRTLIEEFAIKPAGIDATAVKAVESLTDRERDVLICIALGMSNKETARALFLREGTVKTHVSHVLMKLGVRDRAQAVSIAYRAGLAEARTPKASQGAEPNRKPKQR
ncbi:response regulator transcription factor [Arthrobacter sp. USHLN218]|uniref:response regulator transcription factor n=1 Tax=Arthrobacter sp. USHLN218 TaxID=3081232 RepID=UPI00301A2B27